MEALKKLMPTVDVVDSIVNEVCEKYGVKLCEVDIYGKRKKGNILFAAFEIIYRLKTETHMGSYDIADLLGYEDINSLTYAVKRYKELNGLLDN